MPRLLLVRILIVKIVPESEKLVKMFSNENTHSDSQNLEHFSLNQQNEFPITTQPRSEVPELHPEPEDMEENLESRRTRKENVEDCCCQPNYGYDEWEFYMYGQCVGWCCVQLGRCMESLFEGCSECITSCCEGQDTCVGDGCCSGESSGCGGISDGGGGDVECCDCNCFD